MKYLKLYMTISKEKKMLDPDVIIEEAKKNENEPSIDMNMFEMCLYLSIKKIIFLYQMKGYPKEVAERHRIRAIADYNKNVKEWEFWESIFKRHVEINKKTEMQRTKLHKLLNNENADKDEIIKTCMDIISIDYEKEFNYHLYKERNYIDHDEGKEDLS